MQLPLAGSQSALQALGQIVNEGLVRPSRPLDANGVAGLLDDIGVPGDELVQDLVQQISCLPDPWYSFSCPVVVLSFLQELADYLSVFRPRRVVRAVR